MNCPSRSTKGMGTVSIDQGLPLPAREFYTYPSWFCNQIPSMVVCLWCHPSTFPPEDTKTVTFLAYTTILRVTTQVHARPDLNIVAIPTVHKREILSPCKQNLLANQLRPYIRSKDQKYSGTADTSSNDPPYYASLPPNPWAQHYIFSGLEQRNTEPLTL